MRPILFEIPTPWGDLPILAYGLMIVLGFAFGVTLAWWRAKRCGESPEHILNLGLLALVGGVVGGRLLFVAINPGEFFGQGVGHFFRALVNVRSGGLVYFGGLGAALALALWYFRRHGLSARRMLDIIAPSLMLGLAFGRMGCFLNGCCWGGQCTFESPAAQQMFTVTFPFASHPFNQQARSLTWQLVNSEGQPIGTCEPRVVGGAGRPASVIHVAGEWSGVATGTAIKIPLALLKPGWPEAVEAAPWTIVDAAGQPTRYLINSPLEKREDGSAWRVPVASQRDGALLVPAANVVDLADEGPVIDYGYKGEAELRTPIERTLARRFRSLPIYPVQLYGVLNGLLIFYVLTMFFRRRRREGEVFALLLILKPLSRLLLEAIRQDTDAAAFGLTLSQNLSLAMLFAGAIFWLWLWHQPAVAPVPSSGRT